MGTINMKGYKKLPPSPTFLNEDEIEKFGLEEYEDETPENEQQESDVEIILDSEEQDSKDAEMEEVVQTVYLGLRVEDMIKVTAKNKFFNEDGIVRRLKDGKVKIRFYTYGSTFEEWLDPSEVRKLDEIEVLKGLTGPQEPITQRDFDKPRNDSRYQTGPRDRRNMNQGLGGINERNRRQDRVGRQRQDGRSTYTDKKAEENWNWYKDNERRKKGGKHSDGDFDFRGSNPRSDWAGDDVDSQWGRNSQRQSAGGDRRPKGKQRKSPPKVEDDWSAFVSPSPAPVKDNEADDFFASLMTDLSNNLDSSDGDDRNSRKTTDATVSSDDDFFASLMSEISEDDSNSKQSASFEPLGDNDYYYNDDFFASGSSEDTASKKSQKKKPKQKASDASSDLDDFFAEISSFETATEESPRTISGSGDGEADDFFASLEAELESELSSVTAAVDTMSPEENFAPAATVETEEEISPEPKVKKSKEGASTESSSSDTASSKDLSKFTVPVLKSMLKERGLKVSGKKAELIERLTTAD